MLVPKPSGRALSQEYQRAANLMLTDFLRRLTSPQSALLIAKARGGYEQAIRDTVAWLKVIETAVAADQAEGKAP